MSPWFDLWIRAVLTWNGMVCAYGTAMHEEALAILAEQRRG
jgi:hypothetical protein